MKVRLFIHLPAIFIALLLLGFAGANAQKETSETDDLLDMSIEDLMNMQVSIATKVSQTQEEAPSIVSVITSRDIENYGARDITDVLKMVPGFEFGVDVTGIGGIFARGSWGHEGKVLLMIDGMTINDLAYGNYNFFGSLPVSMVSRVEIIRGPGSAVYGGFAETATINIITKKGEELDGAVINTNAGFLEKDLVYGGNASYGMKKDNKEFSIHIGYNQTPLSNRTYTDFLGNEMDMSNDNTLRRWWHIISKAKIGDFKISYNRNSFNYQSQDWYKEIVQPVYGNYTSWHNNFTESLLSSYTFNFMDDKLSIEPQIELIRGNPIATTPLPVFRDTDGSMLQGFQQYQNMTVEFNRNKYQATATYSEEMWNVLAGFGYILDRASGYSVYGRPSFQLSENPADTSANADIQSIYGFLQGMVKFSAFNVTAGFRYEDTDLGSALAPRVGITFVQDKFNAKLLYGRAFRVPMPWQAFSRRWPPIVGAGLQPEITNSAEMELGYKFSKNVQAKINGYYNTIEDQIIFVVSAYTNSPEKVSNMGIEATLNANWEDYGGYLNFSYCKPLDAKLSDYTVVFDENQEALGLIGYPQMMGNMGLYYKYGKFTFAPSLTYLGKRYSQNPTAEELEAGSYSNMRYTENDPLLMLNFAITAREILPKIDATVSMHNIGGAEYSLIQGYFDAHAPIPANDRQITLRITARIN